MNQGEENVDYLINVETDTQKMENSLSLALDASEEERMKSINLNVGYNAIERTWQVIVKYSGREELSLGAEYKIVNLLNEYAIVETSEKNIMKLANMSRIEYVEKPKRLFFQRNIGKSVSCINQLQVGDLSIQGEGVIVGVLDSGIDYRENEFRNENGSTRILEIWDQTIPGNPPEGYVQGTRYTRDEINNALENNILLKTRDTSGHGTEVTSIAAGKSGVAPKADIIVVKLGVPQTDGFPRTTELMQGLDYLVRRASVYEKPIVINVSLGNTYGSHDGSSILERFVDDIANYWKTTICVGTGNEGNASGHTSGTVNMGTVTNIELFIDKRQLSFDLQLWKYYEDDLRITLITPSGKQIGPIQNNLGTQRFIAEDTEILLYYGEPSPISVLQEIYIMFIPLGLYVNTGIWNVELQGIKIVTGKYDFWLPSYGVLNLGTRFGNPTKEGTFTIPSTAMRVISVGAYDGTTFSYADFSGRGISGNPRLVKPDLVAPGVGVQTTTVGGLIKSVSGTSFATPFVTGAAALLTEWGIVQGNDSFMYGEKIKAYLRKGANPMFGFSNYPNQVVGYGRMCVKESLPI